MRNWRIGVVVPCVTCPVNNDTCIFVWPCDRTEFTSSSGLTQRTEEAKKGQVNFEQNTFNSETEQKNSIFPHLFILFYFFFCSFTFVPLVDPLSSCVSIQVCCWKLILLLDGTSCLL